MFPHPEVFRAVAPRPLTYSPIGHQVGKGQGTVRVLCFMWALLWQPFQEDEVSISRRTLADTRQAGGLVESLNSLQCRHTPVHTE